MVKYCNLIINSEKLFQRKNIQNSLNSISVEHHQAIAIQLASHKSVNKGKVSPRLLTSECLRQFNSNHVSILFLIFQLKTLK